MNLHQWKQHVNDFIGHDIAVTVVEQLIKDWERRESELLLEIRNLTEQVEYFGDLYERMP